MSECPCYNNSVIVISFWISFDRFLCFFHVWKCLIRCVCWRCNFTFLSSVPPFPFNNSSFYSVKLLWNSGVFLVCFSALLDWTTPAFGVGCIFSWLKQNPPMGLTLPDPLCIMTFFPLCTVEQLSWPRELWRWFHLLLWDRSPRASGTFLSLCSHQPSAHHVGWPSANFGVLIPRLSVVLGLAISDSFSPLCLLSPWRLLGSICVPPPTLTAQNPSPMTAGQAQGFYPLLLFPQRTLMSENHCFINVYFSHPFSYLRWEGKSSSWFFHLIGNSKSL